MTNFENDLRNMTIKLLKSHKVNYRDKMDTHELLKHYYTFMQKYIVPVKREVLLSEELTKSMPDMPLRIQQAIKKLAVWIADGKDVNGYQSRGLYGQGSRDYQNMIYGIVHLHLSAKEGDAAPKVNKHGFAKPSDYILYAYFTHDHAYLIKAEKHPGDGDIEFIKWVNIELLEIIVKNWPQLMEKKELKGFSLCDASGKPMQLDNNAIAVLTKKHVNTLLCVNNSLYMPGYGISRSGDSAFASIKADRELNAAWRAQLNYDQNSELIHLAMIQKLRAENRPVPDKFDIHYTFHPGKRRFVIAAINANLAWDEQDGVCNLLS